MAVLILVVSVAGFLLYAAFRRITETPAQADARNSQGRGVKAPDVIDGCGTPLQIVECVMLMGSSNPDVVRRRGLLLSEWLHGIEVLSRSGGYKKAIDWELIQYRLNRDVRSPSLEQEAFLTSPSSTALEVLIARSVVGSVRSFRNDMQMEAMRLKTPNARARRYARIMDECGSTVIYLDEQISDDALRSKAKADLRPIREKAERDYAAQ